MLAVEVDAASFDKCVYSEASRVELPPTVTGWPETSPWWTLQSSKARPTMALTVVGWKGPILAEQRLPASLLRRTFATGQAICARANSRAVTHLGQGGRIITIGSVVA